MTARFAPGPSGHPLFGCSREFRDAPLALLLSCRERYGEVVQLPLGFGVSFCLVFGPNDLEKVFHERHFGRSDIAALFEPLAGGSMIIADGEQWKRQRKAIAPSFTQDRLRLLAERVDAEAAQTAQHWLDVARRGGRIDLQIELVSYAMSSLTIFLFGRPLTPQEVAVVSPAWTQSLVCMNRRISQPVPLPTWLPTPNNRLLVKSAGAIGNVLLEIIRERRSHPGRFEAGGFLSDLLAYTDSDTGEGLGDEYILREIMGVFLAGFDTVASAMMWTFYYLSRHSDWQERVRTELTLAPAPAQGRIDFDDTPMLEYVFSESIRLSPPLWLVDRKNGETIELGGYMLPAGTNVITSPYVTHRDAVYWPDPERFDPKRFVHERVESRPKYAYFPFGGGRMKCIGIGLAQLEMKAIARHVLDRLNLSPDPFFSHEIEPAFVLRTRHGMRVRATPNPIRPIRGPGTASSENRGASDAVHARI